ncbi:MAG: quinolinate synthase NadA [Candidatus Bathyarchaeia archaeon]
MSGMNLVERIKHFKNEKKAILLVHNYQRPEIYDVADFIGDSLELSRRSVETDAEMIVFCGVDFMAETAYILNPQRTVLLPVLQARCPMAAMADAEGVRRMRRSHPDAAVVSYVNTSAEVKAESDICCTSANAVEVVNSLDQDEVIFVPDENLALYVQRYSKKRIIPWKGWCYVHTQFSAEELKEMRRRHPDAEVIVHPECKPEVIDLADYVCSTSQMVKRVAVSPKNEFIIGTEVGMIERLKMLYPDRRFYSAPPRSTCIQMKKITLRSILKALEMERHKVQVPEEIRLRAKKALDRMLEL